MKHLLLILTLALFASNALAATRIDLNHGWSFRTDPAAHGEVDGWTRQMPTGVESVNVPHTWNIGKYDDYEGVAWYFRTFELPAEHMSKHVELNFGATFYSSRVWLNGVEVGSHEGGYTAYHLDISPHLQRVNYLAIAIDNRPGIATIPGLAMRGRSGGNVWYDWWHYGGLVRDVWITVNDSVLVRRQRIRTEVAEGSSVLSDRIYLENTSKHTQQLSVHATAFDPQGKTVGTLTQSLSLPPGGTDQFLTLKLEAPELWDIDHPNVYRMLIEVFDGKGKVLDQHNDTFGVRTIAIRDRHLLINGQPVRLSGMTRHEDSPWEGLAETAGTIRYDYDDMKALQVTLTRPVHYPQNPIIFDYADRNGILFIPEIPLWQFSEQQLSDPKVLALAKQQMREMIEQDGNHPSIFGWSVMNESEGYTPGGHAYFRAMRDFIREIDPGRLVSYADDSLANLNRPEDSAASDADFLMMNQYFGSWHGPASALVPALDKIDRMFPGKMVIISEFGTPGLFARNSSEADQVRIETIRTQMKEFARRDWIAGAVFWCYQDYKSHRNLWPGLQEGYVDHGVVDEYRQRRPSYQVWRQINSPATIEITWKHGPSHAPNGFAATITPNTREHLPSYPLRGYRLSWEVRDQDSQLVASGEQTFADLSKPATVSGDFASRTDARELNIHIVLLRPIGFTAAEGTLSWHDLKWGGQTVDQMKFNVPKQ
jgi:beta-glucuronidase